MLSCLKKLMKNKSSNFTTVKIKAISNRSKSLPTWIGFFDLIKTFYIYLNQNEYDHEPTLQSHQERTGIQMKYRNVGNTGLKVSEIGLGSWLTYGTAAEKKAADTCIAKARPVNTNLANMLLPEHVVQTTPSTKS